MELPTISSSQPFVVVGVEVHPSPAEARGEAGPSSSGLSDHIALHQSCAVGNRALSLDHWDTSSAHELNPTEHGRILLKGLMGGMAQNWQALQADSAAAVGGERAREAWLRLVGARPTEATRGTQKTVLRRQQPALVAKTARGA